MKRSTDNFISLQVSGIYPTKSINKSSSIAFSNTLRNLKIFSLNHLIVAAALSNLLITYFFQICGRRNLPRCVASRYLPVQHQQGKHRDRHLSCVIIVKSEHMSHTNLWHLITQRNNFKCTDSNSARSVSEICDGENLKIRLIAFHLSSAILQKLFIILLHHHLLLT